MLLILCLLSLFAQSFAEVNGTGPCPLVESRNFHLSKLLGEWYEYARIPNAFEPGHVCVNCTYYLNENNIAVMHVDSTIRLSGAWYIWEGKLLPTGIKGVYNLKYPSYASLNVLQATFADANWDHWVILQVCSEQSNNNQQVSWVWTKTADLDQEQQNEIEEALERINLPWTLFERTDNHDCPRQRPTIQLPKAAVSDAQRELLGIKESTADWDYS